jgi:hypothetical protein
MKSFVETSDSPYQFKKLIESTLMEKAHRILSNQQFQQAAALGMLEYCDEPDQQKPQLDFHKLIKMFSNISVTDDFGTHSSKVVDRLDTHAEEDDEEFLKAYKKAIGHDLHKDPDFAHFFESAQLDEVHPGFQGEKIPPKRIPSGKEVAPKRVNPFLGNRKQITPSASSKTNYGIGRK